MPRTGELRRKARRTACAGRRTAGSPACACARIGSDEATHEHAHLFSRRRTGARRRAARRRAVERRRHHVPLSRQRLQQHHFGERGREAQVQEGRERGGDGDPVGRRRVVPAAAPGTSRRARNDVTRRLRGIARSRQQRPARARGQAQERGNASSRRWSRNSTAASPSVTSTSSTSRSTSTASLACARRSRSSRSRSPSCGASFRSCRRTAERSGFVGCDGCS